MVQKVKEKKGFTLAELLVVVAIIGVLVAVSIPIFTSQLEKARDAVSIANIRSAYAEAQTLALTATKNNETAGNATWDATNHTVTVSGVAIKGKVSTDDFSGMKTELPDKVRDLSDVVGPTTKSIKFQYDETTGELKSVSYV
ncbi:MAG: type IV pilin protein [Oribacterium sp.]